MTRTRKPRTQLEAFIQSEEINVSRLARSADMNPSYAFALIAGSHRPRINTIDRLTAAASALLGRHVNVAEMFGADFVEITLSDLEPEHIARLLEVGEGNATVGLDRIFKELRPTLKRLQRAGKLAEFGR